MRMRFLLGGVLVAFCVMARPAVAEQPMVYRAGTKAVVGPNGTTVFFPIVRPVPNVSALRLRSEAFRQPERRYRVLFAPNDPQYQLQWNFGRVNISSAWDADQTTPMFGGDPSIVVAVLDTGVAYENLGSALRAPDLADMNVWTNTGETAGDGLDNDGNGLADDTHGWDFINNDAYPIDDYGHGTHIAGTIAGSTNNGIGVAGLAFASTVMPLKVLDESGNGTTSTIIEALTYAVQNGADIINLSLGGNEADPLLEQAISAAASAGVVLVAATGNDGLGQVNYPARYDAVMAVGASQYDGNRSPYSNYGTGIDLLAPGGNMDLDQNNDGAVDGIPQQTCTTSACSAFATYYYSGTSQAAAHVTGIAALLAACGAAPGTIAATMTSTATDVGTAGTDAQHGSGVVNAAAAMAAAGCSASSPSPATSLQGVSSQSTRTTLRQTRTYPYRRPVFSWSGPAGATYQVRWSKNGGSATPTTQTATTYSPSVTSDGGYTLYVTVVDGLGRSSSTASFAYRYRQPRLLIGGTRRLDLYNGSLTRLRSITSPLPKGAPVRAAGASVASTGTERLLISHGTSGGTLVLSRSNGAKLVSWKPFGSSYRGGIDATFVTKNDGTAIIAAAMMSGGAEVRWFNLEGKLLARQIVYRSYRGGLHIASGDLDNDGTDEVVIAQNAGPEIRTYSRSRKLLKNIRPRGDAYTGGWSVDSGDPDGNGRADILAVTRTGLAVPQLYRINAQGQVRKKWSVGREGTEALMSVASADVTGDGKDETFTLVDRTRTVLQRWSSSSSLAGSVRVSSGSPLTLGIAE